MLRQPELAASRVTLAAAPPESLEGGGEPVLIGCAQAGSLNPDAFNGNFKDRRPISAAEIF
jgi:hypothetical protein